MLAPVSLGVALAAAATLASASFTPFSSPLDSRATNSSTACSLDQSKPPGNLTLCGNSTLFSIWRPKARFIAPEGWMNDPQGHWQRSDGSIHAGYQCHPQHVYWGNISQCSAVSKDFVTWEDLPDWKDPKTLYPDRVYDIRGVFDGTIIPKGWGGYPTTIYTSTQVFPLGAASVPPEQEGTETQSLAYTTDGGKSWIKLNFGVNPVIYQWPAANLTGFRDPYVFESPRLAALLKGKSPEASGDWFLTISGGLRPEAYPDGGPRLMLYRQTHQGDFTSWTYLSFLVSLPRGSSYSPWSGNVGVNFETAGVTRLNELGLATDAGTDANAVDFVTYGTELGRNGSHENHWPLWAAVDYKQNGKGVESTIKYAGVLDWGRSYAFTYFPVTTKGRKRVVMIGWTYEDDEAGVLVKQRGYQGAFTLYRDLYLKVIRNVDPSTPGLHSTASWGTRKEKDGSTSVLTLGQKVVPEILSAYQKASKVTNIKGRALKADAGYVPFEVQPKGRFYVVAGTFTYEGTGVGANVGFRVLASKQEYTDIYYDAKNETLVISRTKSSLVTAYGTDEEQAKLKLFNIKGKGREPLVLSVFVDNSVVEVYANDQAVITSRVYPWLTASTGVGFISTGGGAGATVSGVQLWDGLLNAWPKRPTDTRKPLVWDGPLPGIWGGGIWAGY